MHTTLSAVIAAASSRSTSPRDTGRSSWDATWDSSDAQKAEWSNRHALTDDTHSARERAGRRSATQPLREREREREIKRGQNAADERWTGSSGDLGAHPRATVRGACVRAEDDVRVRVCVQVRDSLAASALTVCAASVAVAGETLAEGMPSPAPSGEESAGERTPAGGEEEEEEEVVVIAR